MNIFEMPLSTIILLLSAAFSISHALPWAGPEPTVTYKVDERSPLPTSGPSKPADLFKGGPVDAAVCGWVGGASSDPSRCPTDSSCIFDTAHKYVGCCTASGPCTAGVYTSCVDSHNPEWKSNSVGGSNGVYTCPSGKQCYQNTFPNSYSQWECGSPADATTIETTFKGQPAGMALQAVFTSMNFAPMFTLPETTSSPPLGITTVIASIPMAISASTASSSLTAIPTAIVSNKSKVSGGVIAIAVIIPLSFISLLVGAYFLWWRKRQSYTVIEKRSSFTGAFKHDSRSGPSPGFLSLPTLPPVVQEQEPLSSRGPVFPMTEKAYTMLYR